MLLPDAPVHTAITPSTQTATEVVLGAIAVATLIWAVAYFVRTRRATPLLLFVAGGAMMLFEPMVDTVGAVWFPRIHSHVAFHAYGRPIPVWLCEAYFAYFGLQVSVAWIWLRAGLTRQKLWAIFGLAMIADVILEVTLLNVHAYIYYANQPLVLFKFPFWWAPVNGMIVLSTSAVIARCEGYLVGVRQLAVVPIALTCSASMNAAIGWPGWLAINSNTRWVETQALGLLAFVVAIWLIDVMGKVLVPSSSAVAAAEPERELVAA